MNYKVITMKIYTKIIFDKNDNLLKEDFFEYSGKIANAMGIHYDYKSTKGNKLMEKQAKRERKLAEKKAKRLAKEGPKDDEVKSKTLDIIVVKPFLYNSYHLS